MIVIFHPPGDLGHNNIVHKIEFKCKMSWIFAKSTEYLVYKRKKKKIRIYKTSHKQKTKFALAGELQPVPELRLRVLEQELIGGNPMVQEQRILFSNLEVWTWIPDRRPGRIEFIPRTRTEI
jgi:hypothetical protein